MDPFLPPVPLGAVAAAAGAELRGEPTVTVLEASYDSRDVPAGSLFFCVPGESQDGHDFAVSAVEAGAVAVMAERPLDVECPQLLVPSVRRAMGPASSVLFGDPAASMTLAGVTGTNGKTTITYLLEAVFRGVGRTPGVVGTTGARIDGRPEPLARTTPEAPDLHRLLARMRAMSVDAVAMEVSSHALAQHRAGGLVQDVAVFTNLSQDHLDFHGTMKAYFDAKASLFTPELARAGWVNADDSWGRRLLEAPSVPLHTFAIESEAELRATDVRADAAGISFTVGGARVSSPRRGAFNVANCLAAVAAARQVGIDLEVAAAAISGVQGVPGRMEPVEAGQDFLVVVDYAHTPDSIVNVLRGARRLTTGRVIAVFGCGGGRDRAKRSPMGRAATSSADLTILTTDNPRSEDPLAIIDQIVPGAVEGGGEFDVVPDRGEAIRAAVSRAAPGDVVVIAGKGHETYQEVGNRRLPFDDRLVALEALREEGKGE